jgi:hypothetical protein
MSNAQLLFGLGVIILALRGHAAGSVRTLDVFGGLFIVAAIIAFSRRIATHRLICRQGGKVS